MGSRGVGGVKQKIDQDAPKKCPGFGRGGSRYPGRWATIPKYGVDRRRKAELISIHNTMRANSPFNPNDSNPPRARSIVPRPAMCR